MVDLEVMAMKRYKNEEYSSVVVLIQFTAPYLREQGFSYQELSFVLLAGGIEYADCIFVEE